MDKKVRLISSALIFLIAACNTNQPVSTTSNMGQVTDSKNDDYNVKNTIPDPVFSGNPSPISDNTIPPVIDDKDKTYGKDNTNTKLISKITFDNKDIPYYKKEYIIPGSVSIIYKNSYNIQINSKDKNIKSNDEYASKQLNQILSKYKVKKVYDFVPEKADLSALKKQQEELTKLNELEYPDLSSVHGYEFPEDSDTNLIAQELRKLPFVRTAYPTLAAFPDSVPAPTFIARQGLGDIRRSLPSGTNDPIFANNRESQNWWWYNRHKIFHAWQLYSQIFMGNNYTDIMSIPTSNKPIVAVIDDGFYNGSNAFADKPIYNQGAHFNGSGFVDFDTSPQTTYASSPSHGTAMANVIASPKNNGYGSCGIIPGAQITALKVDYVSGQQRINTDGVAHAISYAYTPKFGWIIPDVISISHSTINSQGIKIPISHVPTVSVQIGYATQNNIPVLISGGNDAANLDAQPIPPDNGQITVGGTSYDSKRWDYSSYGKNIDIAAAALEIGIAVYYPNGTIDNGVTSGTSPATAMVAGAVGMLKKAAITKGINLNPYDLRNIISYSGTLGVSYLPTSSPTTNLGSKILMGRGLDNISNNVDLYAEIRELNLYNALTIVKESKNIYGGGYSTLVRIFNNDDDTWATTNGDWNGRYTGNSSNNYQENYFEESFWGFNNVPSGTNLNFASNNNPGGNRSLGYQIYRNGKYDSERILGVLTRYGLDYLSNNLIVNYNTVGPSSTGLYASWTYVHP